MRLLPERTDHDGEGDAGQESASHRRADPRIHERDVVPLHELLPGSDRHQTRGQDASPTLRPLSGRRWWHERLSGIPKQIEDVLATHRRGFLRSAGLLAVGFGAFGAPESRRRMRRAPQRPATGSLSRSRFPADRLVDRDSWNNTATFYVGKTDPGQGTGTGFRQLMSDELDIAFDKTTCIMGSTDITVDQVGRAARPRWSGIRWPMRRVAAEARRVLLEMASTRLAAPVDQLAVSDAVITVKADPVQARHLWRADRRKEVQCHADRGQCQLRHRSSQNEDRP